MERDPVTVTPEEGRLVGVVTRVDVLAALSAQVPE